MWAGLCDQGAGTNMNLLILTKAPLKRPQDASYMEIKIRVVLNQTNHAQESCLFQHILKS